MSSRNLAQYEDPAQFLATKFAPLSEDFLIEVSHFQQNIAVHANSVPIVFCADENYARYLPVVIQSIIEHANNDHFYHIILFDCAGNTRLVDSYLYPMLERQIEGKPNFSLHVINIYPLLALYSREFKSTSRFPEAAFGRFFAPDLLSMFDKAIYSDLDAIYQSDIRVLMSFDLKDHVIAAVPDVSMNIHRIKSKHIGNHISETIKLDDDTLYVCSGILVFNIKAWQKNKVFDKIIDFLTDIHLHFADQDALNFVCKGQIFYLEQKYGCMTFEDNKQRLPVSDSILARYADLIAEYRQANMSETAFVQFIEVKPWVSINVIKGDLWWSYCRKTEIYSRLLLESCEKLAKPQKYKKEEKEFRVLFLPLFKIKTVADHRLYKLFGINIAKRTQTTGRTRYYVLGLNIFTLKIRSE